MQKRIDISWLSEWLASGDKDREELPEELRGVAKPAGSELDATICAVCLRKTKRRKFEEFAVLQCGHWFCWGCWENLYKAEVREGKVARVRCPSCRQDSWYLEEVRKIGRRSRAGLLRGIWTGVWAAWSRMRGLLR